MSYQLTRLNTDVVEACDSKMDLRSGNGPGGLGHRHLTRPVCGVSLAPLSLFERNKGIGHV